jgi:uncharacterized membrane protein (UPF0127 family)
MGGEGRPFFVEICMSQIVGIENLSRRNKLDIQAKWCESYFCKLRGLTFRRTLAPQEALLLVENSDSVFATTIHMWGVFCELGVIWIDSSMQVVDTKRAKPWRIYAPAAPARYTLECDPKYLDEIQVGEYVRFLED